jgi:ankyrin repeat protein
MSGKGKKEKRDEQKTDPISGPYNFFTTATNNYVFAIRNGLTDVALELIKAGAKLNIQNPTGESPLHAAAGKGNTQVVQALIDAGADSTLWNKNRQSAYSVALKANHKDVVDILLEKPCLVQ